MPTRLYNFIALVLLALFFAPYIMKLQQIDLLTILVIGLAMPAYDFFSGKTEK